MKNTAQNKLFWTLENTENYDQLEKIFPDDPSIPQVYEAKELRDKINPNSVLLDNSTLFGLNDLIKSKNPSSFALFDCDVVAEKLIMHNNAYFLPAMKKYINLSSLKPLKKYLNILNIKEDFMYYHPFNIFMQAQDQTQKDLNDNNVRKILSQILQTNLQKKNLGQEYLTSMLSATPQDYMPFNFWKKETSQLDSSRKERIAIHTVFRTNVYLIVSDSLLHSKLPYHYGSLRNPLVALKLKKREKSADSTLRHVLNKLKEKKTKYTLEKMLKFPFFFPMYFHLVIQTNHNKYHKK